MNTIRCWRRGHKVAAASCRLGLNGNRQDAASTLLGTWGIVALFWAAVAVPASASVIDLQAGRWNVEGALEADGITVGADAVLAGSGTVMAPTAVSGALAPDGTLSFGGAVTFSGGVLFSHAADNATLDGISAIGAVTGTATVQMTRAETAFPTQQVVIAGSAASDYSLFVLAPASNWVKGTSGTLNLWVSYQEYSRVVLYDLFLRMEGSLAQVCWQTASEEDTVGFDLYRWDGGAWVKVNEGLVMARDPMGATYCVADAGANGTEAFLYKLVEIETDGSVREYGPFERAAWTPRLENLGVGENGITLRWLSRDGESYEVRRGQSLMAPLATIADGLPATPPVNEFLDAEKAEGSAFYQIRVEK